MGKQITLEGQMRKKTLTPLNLDAIPFITIGDPALVSGGQYRVDRSFTSTNLHYHKMGVLGCIESGLMGIKSDRQSVVLAGSMMVFVPANTPHFEQGMGTDIFGWYLSLPEDRIKFMPSKICILEMSDLLSMLCKRIVSWGFIKNNSPAQRRLVLTFLDELESAKEARYINIPLPRHTGLYLVATKIIADSYDRSNIDYWAKTAGMSRRSFTRRFSEETGLSFVLWRQRTKLYSALLSLSDGKSVRETGFDLGYQSTSAFIAVFKKQFGCTPKKYVRLERVNGRSGGKEKYSEEEIFVKPGTRIKKITSLKK
jgi:AraC-like DNA-binding protein